jgi:hypothetical protein
LNSIATRPGRRTAEQRDEIDPRHWRQRAEEARALAEDMKGAEAKRMMLKNAEDTTGSQ